MADGISLKDLHTLHIHFRQAQDELERGPRQIRARQQFAERRQAELDAKKEQLLQTRKAVDSKTLQLKSNEAKITDLKVKLNSAASNREYDIFRAQIEADSMANSVLEDEILEMLEKVGEVQEVIRGLEQEVAAARSEEERVSREVAAAEPGIRERMTTLEEKIRSAEKTLPTEISAQYRRLVQAFGSGALAAVNDGMCSVCYIELSPQKRVELQTGRIILCQSCGRLLYPAG